MTATRAATIRITRNFDLDIPSKTDFFTAHFGAIANNAHIIAAKISIAIVIRL